MAVKTDAEVVIGGKVFTLSGYESAEYMQQVGAYINKKLAEMHKTEDFKHLAFDVQSTLVELNIADDYFKAKKQAEQNEQEIVEQEKELYDLKHELVEIKIDLEHAQKEIKSLEKERMALQKKLMKYEGTDSNEKQ